MRTRKSWLAMLRCRAVASSGRGEAQGTTGSGEPQRPRRSPAGISISAATAQIFRREAAASPMAARCSSSNARHAMVRKARAAWAIAWSAVRARSRRQSRSGPSAAIGLMPRRCSIMSAAPCRRTRRNRLATRTSMRFGLHSPYERVASSGHNARRQDAGRDQDAEPEHVHRRSQTGRQEPGLRVRTLTGTP